MGYIPNIYARGLNTTRSYAIGIIMNYLNNPFSSEIFEGAEEVASKNNYMFFLGIHVKTRKENTDISGLLQKEGWTVCLFIPTNEICTKKALLSWKK